MRVNSVDSNSYKNFNGLISTRYAGRFNPETSESARTVIETFKKNSWAMRTLFEGYDVKAVFSTKWFKGHPLYKNSERQIDYNASYAQVDLFIKKIRKERGILSKIRHNLIPWKKITIGEYSNYKADKPLSEAELKLAYTIKKIEFSKLIHSAGDVTERKAIIGAENNFDYRKL